MSSKRSNGSKRRNRGRRSTRREASSATRRVTLIALIMMPALAGTADGGPSEDARITDARGDYATALQLFRLLAEQGDAYTQMSLGDMYFIGLSVPQDYAEGLKWYHRAAAHGDVHDNTCSGSYRAACIAWLFRPTTLRH